MRVPRHRQEWGEFERTIENKKLVIWGRSRSCIEICRKYPVAYIVDNNDELCDIHVENRRSACQTDYILRIGMRWWF